MPVVFDNETGAVIAPQPRLGSTQDTRSFGAAVWELFHPAQVIAENGPPGSPPTIGAPTTYGGVWQGAFDDAMTAAAEGEHNAGEAIVSGGKWLTVIVVAVAIIVVADKIPSQGRIKQYGRKKLRQARQHVAKRIRG
jgi:hypothetical protein